MPDAPQVLAIALDSAEWDHVTGLMADGTMPNLARFTSEASFFECGAEPYVTSGALWPSFAGGMPPEEHGLFYGNTRWDPEAMTIVADPARYEPFWKKLDERGVRVGLLDVPFARHMGVSQGFEVTDWGPHEVFPAAQPMITAQAPIALPHHPFRRRVNPLDPADAVELDALAIACVESADMRSRLLAELMRSHEPELVVVTLTEIHHAAHYLWHRPDDIRAVHAAVDDAFGEVLALAGPETEVLVFSLQGLRPGSWAPAFLPDVLRSAGEWVPVAPGPKTRALAAIKARAPARVRRAYQRHLPYEVQRAVAAPNMFPPTDWSRTTAVTWTSEQNGLIRLNLAGREARGIVEIGEFEQVRSRVAAQVAALRDASGEPLVERIIELGSAARPSQTMPDLVVYWTPAAFADPVRLADPPISSSPGHSAIVARHRFGGFGLLRGARRPPDRIAVEDLAGYMTAPLR